jgi:predicted DNA-binding transcriptional regulator YafY
VTYDPKPVEGHRLALTRRVVHLIRLFEAGDTLSQSELARAFEVSPKTVNRYLKVLQEFYPINRIKRGREVFFRLERPRKRRK